MKLAGHLTGINKQQSTNQLEHNESYA